MNSNAGFQSARNNICKDNLSPCRAKVKPISGNLSIFSTFFRGYARDCRVECGGGGRRIAGFGSFHDSHAGRSIPGSPSLTGPPFHTQTRFQDGYSFHDQSSSMHDMYPCDRVQSSSYREICLFLKCMVSYGCLFQSYHLNLRSLFVLLEMRS